jgi:hypothetical protein
MCIDLSIILKECALSKVILEMIFMDFLKSGNHDAMDYALKSHLLNY